MLSSYYFHLKTYLCIQHIIYKQTNECPRKLYCRFPFKLASCGFFCIFIHYVHFIICSFCKCSCWKPWFSRLHSVISWKAIFELFINSCLYCRHIPYLGCISVKAKNNSRISCRLTERCINNDYTAPAKLWLLNFLRRVKEELKNRLRI